MAGLLRPGLTACGGAAVAKQRQWPARNGGNGAAPWSGAARPAEPC